MGITEIILIISIPGAFGGSLQGMLQMGIWNTEKKERYGPPLLLLQGALFGIGGAMAILLILIWTGRFTPVKTVENQLFLISLSIVSGFVGYRILPKIAFSIEENITRIFGTKEEFKMEVEKEVKEIEVSVKEIEVSVKEVEVSTEYNSAIVLAIIALGENLDVNNKQAIEKLLKIRQTNEEFLNDRKLHILIGRLYKGLKDYGNAIDTLTEFIDRKREKGKDSDLDMAAALYNRACYKILKWTSIPAEDMDTESTLQESAYNDLGLSFHIDPKLTIDAKKDPDLISLRFDTTFIQLTKNSN